MGGLQWALSWLIVLAVGLAAIHVYRIAPGNQRATRRKKPIRRANNP